MILPLLQGMDFLTPSLLFSGVYVSCCSINSCTLHITQPTTGGRLPAGRVESRAHFELSDVGEFLGGSLPVLFHHSFTSNLMPRYCRGTNKVRPWTRVRPYSDVSKYTVRETSLPVVSVGERYTKYRDCGVKGF